jgi:probable HAF family extracellular repeat protein
MFWNTSAMRLGALLGAMVAAQATTLAQSSEYTLTNLGIPVGADTIIGLRMNNSGHVAGYSIYYGQLDSLKGWVWTPSGGFTVPPPPPGMPWDRFAAKDISDTGILAGDGGGDSGPGWRYENGVYTIIDLVPGTGAARLGGVNNAGDVAGTGFDGSIATPDKAWLDINGTGLFNLTPGTSGGRATGINNAGQVCGYTQGPLEGFEALRWDENGGTQFLGTLGLSFSFANAINDSGQVVGSAKSANGNIGKAWIYTDGVGQQEIPAPPGETVTAVGINNQGHVVGWTHASGPDIGWLWTPQSGLRTLHEIFDFAGAGFSAVTPRDINDVGQILVGGFDNNATEWRTVLLTPVGIPGDLNGDGRVDLADLGILLADFGCMPPAQCVGDIDRDGDTDLADLGILLANFGR